MKDFEIIDSIIKYWSTCMDTGCSSQTTTVSCVIMTLTARFWTTVHVLYLEVHPVDTI